MTPMAKNAIAALLFFSAISVVSAPSILAQDLSETRADLKNIEAGVNSLERDYLRGALLEDQNRFAARMNDGQFFFYSKEYDRAAMVLMDLVEAPRHRGSPGYRDAVYFLAESLFRIRNYSAATKYLDLLINVGSRPQRQHAVARLLDLATKTNNQALGDKYASRVSGSQGEALSPQLNYALGKYRYRAGEFVRSKVHFSNVGLGSEEYLRARYFLGVISLKLVRLDDAKTYFKEVVDAEPDSGGDGIDDQNIKNQARLALARIAYEQGKFDEAVGLYNEVPRQSVEFDSAMYESVWISVKKKDYEGALRKLELLLISQPDVLQGPDAKLLEGKLQLMMSRYENAEAAFTTVSDSFGAVRDEMARIIEENPNLARYFGRIIGDQIAEFDLVSLLPPKAAKIAGEDMRTGRALDLVGDIAAQRRDVTDADRVIQKLEAALGSDSRIEMFPKLHMGVLRAIELQSRLLLIQGHLNELSAEKLRNLTAEYRSSRSERQSWQARYAQIPRTVMKMKERDAKIDAEMVELEQSAHRLNVDLRAVEAQLVAITKYLKDTDNAVSAESAKGQVQKETELSGDIRDEIASLTHQIEDERLKVGLNDYAADHDERVEERFRASIEAELQIIESLGGSVGRDLRARCKAAERLIKSFIQRAQGLAESRVRELITQVKQEKANLTRYSSELRTYEGQTRSLGGTIAAARFKKVLDRISSYVLVADVGLADVAWKQKDDKSKNIGQLIEKQREEYNAVDAAFNEVVDD